MLLCTIHEIAPLRLRASVDKDSISLSNRVITPFGKSICQIKSELLQIILADLSDAATITWHSSVNAVSESFFHTLKTELIHQQTFHSREKAKLAVFEYIEVFYNRERLHSANGYISPVEFELQQNAA